MTNPLEPRIVSAGEAAALVDKHNLRQKLSTCVTKFRLAEQDDKHKVFCCTITLVEYFDTAGHRLAVEERQVFVQADKPESSVFVRFQIGEYDYIVRPAAIQQNLFQAVENTE